LNRDKIFADMHRRSLVKLGVKLGGLAAAGFLARTAQAQVSLFDGKTLDGWLQIENNATLLSTAAITDPRAFAAWLTNGSDPVSEFLRSRLPESTKSDLAAWSPSAANANAVISALVKDLNKVITGPSVYDKDRFTGIVLRRETASLIVRNPRGAQLSHLNKLLLEDAYPEELSQSPDPIPAGWTVKDGAMASTGSGRGVIYTANDYSRFRLTFTMRHVSGNPDHQACVLIFCTRPQPDENPLDALAGIQFQPPNGGHWDYRPAMNNAGGAEFTSLTKTKFDAHEWSRVEILADAATGTARMAVAQPPGSQAVEVLDFKDPTAGKAGPIAWQMHNPGLFDEYKDIAIDLNPR
jgi:3-keto-disaccharide hydrolase